MSRADLEGYAGESGTGIRISSTNRSASFFSTISPPYFSVIWRMLLMPKPWYDLSFLSVTGSPSSKTISSPQ